MSDWYPHITVATIVPNTNNTQFLFVEEYAGGDAPLINQPAGHLDPNESLIEAAIRETYEETGWHVDVTGFIGIALLNAPNGICYQRNTFLAQAIKQDLTATLDTGIIRPLWLSLSELIERREQWRSQLVHASLQQYLQGEVYPLSIFYS